MGVDMQGRPSPGIWLAIAIVLLLAHAALLRGFVVDDAFITFRHARNIAEGVGPVFNPGERVEGFSNPVLTYLLAALYPLAPDTERFPLFARLPGLLAAIGSLVLLARLPGLKGHAAIPLALVLAALSPSLALWSVAGLEATLYGFLIMAGFALTLARPQGAPGRAGLGLVLGLITLSRPEGVLPASVLFLSRFADAETRRDLRGHGLVALAAAVPVIGYVAFRHAFYGEWLPNTYYAKKLPLKEALGKGRYYLTGFMHANGGRALYVPVIFALFDRAQRRSALLAFALIAVYVPFILMVGGDWMQQHRFLAPLVPLIMLVTALGWTRLFALVAAGARRVGWPGGETPARLLAFVLPVALIVSTTWPAIERQRRDPYVSVSPYFDTMGRVLGIAAPREWVLAVHDIGAVGWYGRTRILDLLGLVEPDIAHHRATGDELVARRRPELVLLHYDNRRPPRERWRPIDMAEFDRLYVVPRSPVVLPGSLRVRADVVARFEAGLTRLPPELARDLLALDRYLGQHEPDGYVILPRQPEAPAVKDSIGQP
jgi:hypothetical protein